MLTPAFFLLLLTVLSDARVTFQHSVILDEFDFVGQSSVAVAGLCSDTCHLYASIAPESKKLADNILIQTAKGFTSLSTLAYQRNEDTSVKLPLEISNTATLTIVNGNSGNAAGPLVIYVVNKAASFFGNAVVYDADGLDRPQNMAQQITILSARPFTLTQSNYAPMQMAAHLAGFDTIGADSCATAYTLYGAPFPGFTLLINTPIITLNYNVQQFRFPIGELEATIGITSSNQMQLEGFVASPGYHGCAGKPAYRSSLYDMACPFLSEIVDAAAQNVTYNVLTNSDDAHALVVLSGDGDVVARIHDVGDKTPQVGKIMDSQRVQFSWTPQPDTYFLVTYNSTANPTITN